MRKTDTIRLDGHRLRFMHRHLKIYNEPTEYGYMNPLPYVHQIGMSVPSVPPGSFCTSSTEIWVVV